jgi:hypothetical protein
MGAVGFIGWVDATLGFSRNHAPSEPADEKVERRLKIADRRRMRKFHLEVSRTR